MGFKYEEVNIETDGETRSWLIEQGHRTMPQIYHKGKVLVEGGAQELAKLSKDEINTAMGNFDFDISMKLQQHIISTDKYSMTQPIVRQGDRNSAGGRAIMPRTKVQASGRNLAAYSSRVTPHPCCGRPGYSVHCRASVTGGAPTVYAEGKPVHIVSDSDTCGHRRVQGDNKVLVYK